MEVKAQLLKASLPILVTDAGMVVTEVKPMQA
jgi:hypothetical protein